MILSRNFYIKNTVLSGKVSPSNLRYVGVEQKLIDEYTVADSELKAYTSRRTELGEEYSIEEENRLRDAKFKALDDIEKRLEELED